MIKLNRKIEYALVALKHISGKFSGQLTTAKEISNATNVPFDATSRVMQLMAQRNILKAEHGINGGYLLVSNLSKLSFLNVIEAVSGPIEVVRCVSQNSDCELIVKCNVSSPLRNFNEKLVQFYANLTVAELLQLRDAPKESLSKEKQL